MVKTSGHARPDARQSVNTRSSQLQRITSSFVRFVSLVDWWISTFLSRWRRMLAWLFSATRNHRSRRKTSMASPSQQHKRCQRLLDFRGTSTQGSRTVSWRVCDARLLLQQLLHLMNTFTQMWTLSTLWPSSLQPTCLLYTHLKYETSSQEFRGRSWHDSWMTTWKNVSNETGWQLDFNMAQNQGFQRIISLHWKHFSNKHNWMKCKFLACLHAALTVMWGPRVMKTEASNQRRVETITQ